MLSLEALEKWRVDLSLDADNVDLNNCDREPIHIPGAIQPHGALLVLDASADASVDASVDTSDLRIVQVSANVETLLGLSVEQLLNSSLDQWFPAEQIEQLQGCLAQDFDSINPLRMLQPERGTWFNGIAHRSGDVIVLELEPTQQDNPANFFDFYSSIKAPLNRLQQAQTLAEICDWVTQEVKRICGFDRVMIYRFDDDGSGSVVAEARREDLEPFLGLRYPDSDIPRQAKLLYIHNKLRIIPDRTYEPVPLVPELNPLIQAPTDLSHSVLRSVSPVHLEYLANMGVAASMSISLVQDGKLWGLIACHHCSPHRVDYGLRAVCEFIGQVAALEIAAKEEKATLNYCASLAKIQGQLIQSITPSKDLISALAQPQLLSLVNATGAVIIRGEKQSHVGATPSEDQVNSLIEHLERRLGNEAVYQTNRLSDFHLDAENYKDIGSGLMALSISKVQRVYLLWFRQEIIQTVDWAGEPKKAWVEDENGETRILPRKSFLLWKETVQAQSEPWQSCEVDIVQTLRTNLLSRLLKNADELVSINRELSRSNDELDAFAYIASHDLKEPLRGIYNYSSFLMEDYAEQLDEPGRHKLKTLMWLTKRMESLIESLLHFSRLERAKLNLQSVGLRQLLAEVLETLEISRKTSDVEVTIAAKLPKIRCDRVQIYELYSNLISNAIKYNDSEHKQIELGVLRGAKARAAIAAQGLENETASDLLLYVRDNGIGIRQRHLSTIFKIFKRLHAPKRYGGGTGAGLTIVKKIVERHGGVIWVDSVYGEGSTFYFTVA